MGKVIGILLFVVAIWLGLQYYAGESPGNDPEQVGQSVVKRTGERVQEALDSGSERREALIPD